MSNAIPSRFVFLCGAHMDQVMRLAAPAVLGSSNPAEIHLSPGGAALNSAGIAAACGLKSHLVSPIGDDAFGTQLQDTVKERGVVDGLVVSEGATGVYSVMFDPDGDVVIGAAGLSIYSLIDRDWIEGSLAEYRNNSSQSGILINANLESDLLNGAIAGFRHVAAATISPAKAPRLLGILGEIQTLFTNRKEACALLGASNETPGKKLADQLREAGVKSGTISDGANALHWWCGKLGGSLLPSKVAGLVDVNGAGDALAGSVLALLSKGHSFEKAVRVGMDIAALTLKHSGPYPPNAKSLFQSVLQDHSS